jgi:hypothetical protein
MLSFLYYRNIFVFAISGRHKCRPYIISPTRHCEHLRSKCVAISYYIRHFALVALSPAVTDIASDRGYRNKFGMTGILNNLGNLLILLKSWFRQKNLLILKLLIINLLKI